MRWAPVDYGCFQGYDLAAAIDRLKVQRRGLSLQSEKHVARPACMREQQQRTASQGNRTEDSCSTHMQIHTWGYVFFITARRAFAVSYDRLKGQPTTHMYNEITKTDHVVIHIQHFCKHTLPFGQSPSQSCRMGLVWKRGRKEAYQRKFIPCLGKDFG